MWCPTTATFLSRGGRRRMEGGNMRGPLIWLLQGPSVPKMLQVLGKQSLSMLLPLKKALWAVSALSYTQMT